MSQRRHLFSTFQQCSVNLSGWLSIVSSPINCSSWHSWAYEKGLIYTSYFSYRPFIKCSRVREKILFSLDSISKMMSWSFISRQRSPFTWPIALISATYHFGAFELKAKSCITKGLEKNWSYLVKCFWIILTITSGHCLEGGRSLFLGKTIWWESEMLIVANNQIPRESNFENQFV